MEQKSVFELILSGELDSEIIYEDDEIFAINDINPVAKPTNPVPNTRYAPNKTGHQSFKNLKILLILP